MAPTYLGVLRVVWFDDDALCVSFFDARPRVVGADGKDTFQNSNLLELKLPISNEGPAEFVKAAILPLV